MADALNLALLSARAWVGAVMFVHGWRHVKALQSGPGMANWLEGLGLRNGPLQAQLLTWSEVAVGPMLALGLLTPAAYGAVASLMLVALVTNHRDKGFFVTARPTEGWEYVGTLAVLSVALGTVGPGRWSLDHAIGLTFPFEPDKALLAAAVVGIGGTLVYLATFWRPPVRAES
ncbi:MAG: DoxX family protein [Acidimicrobiia bacterium]|nr:DoxX family protein [Acidimicrobiia bacterium]MBV8560333.1 DoxX family protein [Acidimicrobiia bacterium]